MRRLFRQKQSSILSCWCWECKKKMPCALVRFPDELAILVWVVILLLWWNEHYWCCAVWFIINEETMRENQTLLNVHHCHLLLVFHVEPYLFLPVISEQSLNRFPDSRLHPIYPFSLLFITWDWYFHISVNPSSLSVPKMLALKPQDKL